MNYEQFLSEKTVIANPAGITVDKATINPVLKFHQREMVAWLCLMGRAACFASFGTGKTVVQLETIRLIRQHAGGMGLIVCPLGVRGEFVRDAHMLGMSIRFVRSAEECEDLEGIYITNYETIRDGKLDPRAFTVTSLDEAAILRGFGATKTFREFMRLFDGVRFKFIATATPSPNEFIELLAYSAYLEIMDVGQAKTRFFKRDSTKADKLTLHSHKTKEFWLWVSSWAIFVQKPSDIGGDDTGYDLPALKLHWHEIPADHSTAGESETGQMLLLAEQAQGLQQAAREKRDSLTRRIDVVRDIIAKSSDPQAVIWCDLNAEQDAIGAMLKESCVSASSLYGAQSIDEREGLMDRWRAKETRCFVSKPQMYGAGVNLQQCHTMVFSGIGFKFADFIQGVHRIYRFLQENVCDLHMVYTENERQIREILERKWAQHREMGDQMTEIISEHGLSNISRAEAMARAMGVNRIEISTDQYRLVHNDCVLETRSMESDSVGLILTSIPFSTQYEYSPNYADFGHTDDNEHFFRQMDYLTPELLRVLKPGRMAVIHVKDRIVPGGMTGLGFQTVYPFHARCIEHYTLHGFGYMGMKTIVTDVVRENNQTYRLGWTEQCKDGTKMGVGMPEYLLMFRKPQTDTMRAYTDDQVVKPKPLVFTSNDDSGLARDQRKTMPMRKGDKRPCVRGTGYSRARWQIDAHGFARSSGDRFPTTEEINHMPHEAIFKAFRKYGMENVYEYEQHVGIGEDMEESARLPVTFMLLQPPSWNPDVWTDIARMRCLNGEQKHKGKQMHLCIAKGSLVLTRDGYIPIEEVKEGDETLTHMGRWRKVLAARMTGENREVVDLRAQGVASLRITPDHKVWTRMAAGKRAVDSARATAPGWTEAADTVGHYINLKLPPVEITTLTWQECWIVGRWLADGHIGTRGDYYVSIGPDKFWFFEIMAREMIGAKSHGTAIQVRLKGLSQDVKDVLSRCGRGASGKRIPSELLSEHPQRAAAIIDGYMSGDGNYIVERKRWQATSVSRSLLLGIAMLAQRAYGTTASISPGRPAGESTIQGRTVNTLQEWNISFDDGSVDRRKQPFLLEDGSWKKVRSADYAGTEEVWCLKVEEDESFTAEGCIVKNCPMQFDIADRVISQMSNEGDIVLDPFGGLMTVPYRAILKRRIGIGIELSRQYFDDGAFYCNAAVREMAQPTLFDFLDAEEEVLPEGIEEEANPA